MKLHGFFALVIAWCGSPFAHADFFIAKSGKPRCVIVRQPENTAAESYAAELLADTLRQVVGAEFKIENAPEKLPKPAIIVGPGRAADTVFPEILLDRLGPEEIIIKAKGDYLLLAGGRPRGTLYAVSRFLQDSAGVRWWTPWASRFPARKDFQVRNLEKRARPAFEARDPFWFCAFDKEWAARNFSNSQHAQLKDDLGGAVIYKGFVHTFEPLVPLAKHYAEHPEWYSLIKGQRTTNHTQLCLTNPKLRDFMVERVKQWLKESPQANIVSVSQNDWRNPCECPECKAVDDAEGSHAGTLLALVNYIGEKIEPEFPRVAIDTLAYQYTRKSPKTIRPRPNVIVRLCSIECNFRETLEEPSNATFAEDIKGWAGICNRLYVWDYTTDFAHYLQPHPNYYALGPNLRFFHKHNVRGMFEQGAYQAFGGEMAEMRAWVLAQLMWNPYQDDRALIKEFLEGYYGPHAALSIQQYLDLMHVTAKGCNLTCFSKTDVPFLQFAPMQQAEALWREAEKAAQARPDYALRARFGRIWLGYVWLSRWDALRKQCDAEKAEWPLPSSKEEFAKQWLEWTKGVPDKPWTQVKLINERGTKPEDFVAKLLPPR